jgi:uncharacterized protein (DUF1697 family)
VAGPRRQTYAALLCGVNLGSRNKVSMADLGALVAALGYEDVRTYLQSGNVVFVATEPGATIVRRLEEALARELGVPASVIVRTRTELRRVVDANPFARRERDPKKLLVTFLADTPSRAAVRALDPTEHAPDEFAVVRREVYLHCPNGYGRTKLSNAYFERKLGVAGTNRNWRTVTALAELAGGGVGGRKGQARQSA